MGVKTTRTELKFFYYHKTTTMKNLEPFDLETALAHPERVVTRDGRKVEQLTKFDVKQYALCGIVKDDQDITTWTLSGKFIDGSDEKSKDLFLLPEVKEC
jgi:hypothetical protein